MEYDETYGKTKDYFGQEPTPVLKRFYHLLDKAKPVLDIGAGQGRNALFLGRRGFTVDAIDPSKVSIDTVSGIAEKEKLPIRTFHCGFDSFVPQTDFYSGILIFGLIQDLPWESIDLLLESINRWTREGSLVFVTAFTTEDPSFVELAQKRRKIGKNSFVAEDGHTTTYLERGEILDLFGKFKAIHHWEGLGPKHRHGDGAWERHGSVEAVFQR